MSAKKSFIITLRIFFVLFSLQFVRDAFYKWDGYSYYIKFTDFLPYLSLVFILWIISAVIFAIACWLIIYGLSKIFPKPLKVIRFEHILFFVIIYLIKITFFEKISLSGLIGLSRFKVIIIAVILIIPVVLFIRKYINFEKILYGINSRITPVIWLFALLLILAVPLSMFTLSKKIFIMQFKHEAPETKYISKDSTYGAPAGKKRPNIILVTMDALTALDMQVYGYNRPTTPFISEWSKDAIFFKRAYSSSNWTTPTTMSLMTSQRPWTHRIWYYVDNFPVSSYEYNLPLVLRDYGYSIYGFVQNVMAHPDSLGMSDAFLVNDRPHKFSTVNWWFYKFQRKIDDYIGSTIVTNWIFSSGFIGEIVDWISKNNPDVDRHITATPPEKVYNNFLNYISEINPSELSQRPFFAWLHVFPPHEPYLPPKPYMGMFGDAEKFITHKEQEKKFRQDKLEYKPEMQADVDILRKRYDEFIVYSDEQFKYFLSRLSGIIDMSNTIVILSSDHGESFSHGVIYHEHSHLYEQLVHIPLIIKIPWKTDVEVIEIDMPVEQIDIAPTILELADIPVPEWMEGRSLIPLLKGKLLEPRPIFSMKLIKNRVIGNPPITKGTFAVWDGDYKLIYYLEDKKTLLFNLKSDPDEMKDISRENPEITQRLMKLIEDNISRADNNITQTHEK